MISSRLGLVLTLAISAFVLLPTFGFGLGFDHGVLHYVAWGALGGHWPYSEIWDTSFPGVLPLHVLAVALGDESALSLRLLDFFVELATAALLYETGRRLYGPTAGFAAATLYMIAYVSGGYYNTAQRDGFMVPLLLAVLLLLWSDTPPRWRLLVCGLLLGVVCLIRPTYALVAAAGGAVLLLRQRHPWPTGLVRLTVWFAIPGLLPVALFLILFAAAGRLEAVRDTVVYLGSVYTDLDRKSSGHVLLKLFLDTPQSLWIGAVLCPIALTLPRVRRGFLWIGSLFLLTVAIRLIEAKTYRYQFWPPLACAALVAGVGWAATLERLAQQMNRLPRTTLALLLSVTLIIPLLTTRVLVAAFVDLVPRLRTVFSTSPAYDSLIVDSPEQVTLAHYLRAHTQPSDRILLWGPGPGVYYATQRLPASRFFVSTAFLCVDANGDPTHLKLMTACDRPPSAVQWQFREEFLRDVGARRAAYIVTVASEESIAVWDGESVAPDFPELRAIVARDYEVETVIGQWAVRKRRP